MNHQIDQKNDSPCRETWKMNSIGWNIDIEQMIKLIISSIPELLAFLTRNAAIEPTMLAFYVPDYSAVSNKLKSPWNWKVTFEMDSSYKK